MRLFSDSVLGSVFIGNRIYIWTLPPKLLIKYRSSNVYRIISRVRNSTGRLRVIKVYTTTHQGVIHNFEEWIDRANGW